MLDIVGLPPECPHGALAAHLAGLLAGGGVGRFAATRTSASARPDDPILRLNRDEEGTTVTYRTLFCSVAFSAGAAMSAPVHAQETLRLTIGTGQAEAFLWIRHLRDTFLPVLAEELARTGEVVIEWTEGYGGTIVRQGSEVEALQQGIIDVGQLSGTYSPSQLGILNLTFAMPFGPQSPRLVTQAAEHALQESGALEMLEDVLGVVYVGGGFALDSYDIGSSRALEGLEDFDGVRIGGVGAGLAWVGAADAVGVQGSLIDHYNNLQSGLYEGYLGFITGSVPARMYEVAPYWTDVGFGAAYVGGIAVSKARWDSFSEATRAAFRTAAAAYSDAYLTELQQRFDAGRQLMADQGVTFIPFSDAQRRDWADRMENPVTAWAGSAEARGEPAREVLASYRDYLAAQGFEFPRDYLAD